MPEGELDASQHRNGRTQYLDGPIESVARYASWWREQVTLSQEIILCGESYSTDVQLRPGITQAQILEDV